MIYVANPGLIFANGPTRAAGEAITGSSLAGSPRWVSELSLRLAVCADMAGGMQLETSRKGGRKPLDAAINLVPFIDLMAVTISFLIMTAVWNQVGRLQVSESGGAPTHDVPSQPELRLVVTISDRGLVLSMGATQVDFPKKAGTHDLIGLAKDLVALHGSFPAQRAVTISAEDGVRYDDLVQVIDRCIGAGLPDISVTPAI